MYIQNNSKYFNLEEAIIRLKKRKNAIILSHYYQTPEIQDIADYIGDSLELSRKASKTSADIIVFCGVKFMAEAAYILNPTKMVLLPDLDASCSLELSCQPKEFFKFREFYYNHVSLTYINCSAEIKAMSDIIVTSSSAEKIINSIPKNKPILFAPDKHLGNYLIKKTGRQMKLWNGTCVVHENFSEREIIKIKTIHTKAKIIAHPECPENLLYYADYIGSTSQLINYTAKHSGEEFIVLTEPGIIHEMKKKGPNSTFHEVKSINQSGCLSCSNCPYMKLNTLEKVYACLNNETPKIELNDTLVKKARKSLEKMLELTK